MSYSDEPILVTPARRWSLKVILGITLVLLVVGGLLSIPLYQDHVDKAALHARRGAHRGALYDITIGGRPHTLELGWIVPAFSATLTPAPASGTTLEVDGDFGDETLKWDPAAKCFGPGTAHLDAFKHYKVTLTLRENGQVLWHDTLWFYGLIDSHGH